MPTKRQDEVFGFMAGEFRITRDIASPIAPPDQWQVLRETDRETTGKKAKKE